VRAPFTVKGKKSVKAILAALPGTANEIADKVHLSESRVRKWINFLVSRDRVYVLEWVRPEKGRDTAIYARGRSKGWVAPKIPTMTALERMYDSRRRLRADKERYAEHLERERMLRWAKKVVAKPKRDVTVSYLFGEPNGNHIQEENPGTIGSAGGDTGGSGSDGSP
jgi:predicted ArsR family transcriptional regulator